MIKVKEKEELMSTFDALHRSIGFMHAPKSVDAEVREWAREYAAYWFHYGAIERDRQIRKAGRYKHGS